MRISESIATAPVKSSVFGQTRGQAHEAKAHEALKCFRMIRVYVDARYASTLR